MTIHSYDDPRCIRCGATITNESLEEGLTSVMSKPHLRLRVP